MRQSQTTNLIIFGGEEKMFLVYLQSYGDLSSTIEPFEILPDGLLNESAKKYIIQEQGTRRAEEPIRTLEEMEREKSKLEKGYYLVSPSPSPSPSSTCADGVGNYVDVYELTIGEEGYILSAARLLKRHKKISICKLPRSFAPTPFTSTLACKMEEKVVVSNDRMKMSTHPAFKLGLTSEILSEKKDRLRRATRVKIVSDLIPTGTFVKPELRHVKKSDETSSAVWSVDCEVAPAKKFVFPKLTFT